MIHNQKIEPTPRVRTMMHSDSDRLSFSFRSVPGNRAAGTCKGARGVVRRWCLGLVCCGVLIPGLAGCVDNDTPMVARHRALLAEQRGDFETTLRIRDELIERFPDYYFLTDVYFEQGVTHLENGNPEKALEYLNQSIERDPENLQAYIRRCQAHSQLGNHEAAIADGNRALELSIEDRNLALALLHQGNSQAAQQKLARAKVKWQLSLLLNADQIPALIQLFTAFMNEANYEEALQVIEDSLQRNDRVAHKHLMHSQVLMALGRREEAEAALEEARKRNVGDALALPASVDEYVFAQPLEEAPMVRTAAKPVFEQNELPLAFSQNDTDEPALQDGELAVALAAARNFLQEQGWQVTHSEQLPPHVLTCRQNGEAQPVEILVKVVPHESARRMVLSQADLDLISAVSPPRGMLVVALTENPTAATEAVGESASPDAENAAAEQAPRVLAFTPSWRPDPFRLVPTRYEYQLPSEQ